MPPLREIFGFESLRRRFAFFGWRMVLVGCLFRFLGGGFHFYGFTVFFLPLSQDLGINRAATSLVFSLARAEGAIEGPLAGYLIDRFGPRPIMVGAVLLTGVGYIMLYWVDTYVTFLIIYMAVISLAFGAGFMHCPMVLANSWFSRWRARAMALVSCSIGLGGAFLAPLLAVIVNGFGWRAGVLFAGATFLVFGLPLAALVKRSPESIGLLPDGAAPAAAGETAGQDGVFRDDEAQSVGIWEAMRGRAFWLIVLSTLIRVLGLSTIIVHFVPIMVWKGGTEQWAAVLLGIFAFLSFPTHMIVGWLADRHNKPNLMAGCMLIATFGLVLLIYAPIGPLLWLFLPCFSLVEAVFPVTWAMVGDLYGRRHFAKIRGNLSLYYQWGGFIGPVVAGWTYDTVASYTPMLWALVGLYVMGAGVYLLLSKPWAARLHGFPP